MNLLVLKNPLNQLKIVIGLVWLFFLGTYAAKHWFDPQLPTAVLHYMQNFTDNIFFQRAQYTFIGLLFLASVFLWMQNKWGQLFLFFAIGFLALNGLITGPMAMYKWTSLFRDLFPMSVGVLLGMSLNRKNSFSFNAFRGLVVAMIVTLIAVFVVSELTDGHLPKMFTALTDLSFKGFYGTVTAILSLLYPVALLILSIALICKVGIARNIVLGISIISILLFSLHVDALTGWDQLFCILNDVFMGAVFVLMFQQPIAQAFQEKMDYVPIIIQPIVENKPQIPSEPNPIAFFESLDTCIQKYATFSGRASRSEFWWFQLLKGCLVVLFLFHFYHAVVWFTIPLLLPAIAVQTRRLHDVNKSGWWQLLKLIPVIGLIILYYWSAQKGQSDKNRFGEAL